MSNTAAPHFSSGIRDPRVDEAKEWAPNHYKQEAVQPHGDFDQQQTEYAVIKSCDMNEKMQQHAVDCVAFAF